jgi:hypothetical protein
MEVPVKVGLSSAPSSVKKKSDLGLALALGRACDQSLESTIKKYVNWSIESSQ